MSFDIFHATCPKCGNNTLFGEGFRVQVDADAVVRGVELVSLDLVEVHYDGDMSCLSCGYNGHVEEFCEGEVDDA